MAKTNLVNELFKTAGYDAEYDNRSYFVKTLNKILSDGLITIKLNEKGFVWTNKNYIDKNNNLVKFNIEIKGFGMIRRPFCKDITPKELLKQVSIFIKGEKVQQQYKSKYSVNITETCICPRCNGQGYIKAFSHVCDGICFECYATGYSTRQFELSV